MFSVFATILPIFLIIILGAVLRRIGLMPDGFLKPANRLVFMVAIPVMVFQKVSAAHFEAHFNPLLIAATMAPIIFMILPAWYLARSLRLESRRMGTFVQSSFHGNIGYVGLAVAYYYLGEDGFTTAGVITGFLMLLQNLQSVILLSRFSAMGEQKPGFFFWFRKVAGHPVIIGSLSGLVFSAAHWKMPFMIDQSFKIISGMALPMGLLIIGASLSFELFRNRLNLVIIPVLLKLFGLPAIALAIYVLFGLPAEQYVPGLVLLGAPTATICYIMAGEMGGDVELASAAVSAGTLASALSYAVWLGAVG